MKILEFIRSGIELIAEFRGILSGFPNQGGMLDMAGHPYFHLYL